MLYCNSSNLCYQITGSPLHLLQALLSQMLSGTTAPTLQQLSSIFPIQPQVTASKAWPQGTASKKPSRGIKAYPDGWQKVLNSAKDVVRGSVLVKDPFPSANIARIAVSEAFHEVQASECNVNGLVLEPGMSPLMRLQPFSSLHKKQDSHGPKRWFRL